MINSYDFEDAERLRASVSALDAYIRHFEVRVPPDAVAHIHEDLADAALKMMEGNMGADLTPAEQLLSD